MATQGVDGTLKTELARTRESIDELAEKIEDLNRHTRTSRVMIIVVSVLVVLACAGISYGYWYVRDAEKQDRATLEAEREILETAFYTGCQNAVSAREESRAELLSFMQYLGEQFDLTQAEIDASIAAQIEEFDTEIPVRDCDAERAARAEERQEIGR